MRRLDRWSRSIAAVVTCNALLVALAIGVGWHASLAGDGRFTLPPAAADSAAEADREERPHVQSVLSGNLLVVAKLLAGACSLGLFTLAELLGNAFVLGFGLQALARGAPETLPLVIRYAPLEFSAFVLTAGAAEHLSFSVLRCLATGERVRLTPVGVALVAAVGMLLVAAIIEADVTRVVATLER